MLDVGEPGTTCSDERHARALAGGRRYLRLPARLQSFDAWVGFLLVYLPVVPLLSAALLGAYFYARSNRPVYFVNGLAIPIVVEVDGNRTLNLAPHAFARLSMTEGAHHSIVSEPQVGFEPVDFHVGGRGTSGLWSSSTLVVDPTRSAILFWEETTYTTSPAGRKAGVSKAHFGEAFVVYPRVDYPFEAFPGELDLGSGASLRKTRIALIDMPARELVQGLLAAPDRAEDALRLLENRLRASPDDVTLLSGYWVIARRQNQVGRCRDFLSTRLNERPVLVDWHRLYQTVCEDVRDESKLLEQYDAWLADEPANSALLFLRGRCDPDRSVEMDFYESAIAADPENAYPRFAESRILLARGEFAGAYVAARMACQLRPANLQMKLQLAQTQMAIGEYDELVAELRASLHEDPWSMPEQERLLEVLVAAEKPEQAQQALCDITQQLAATQRQEAPSWIRQLQNSLLYFQGDFEGLLAADSPTDVSGESALWRFRARFELRRQIEPTAGLNPVAADHDGYSLLCQAMAWAERGDEAAAAQAKRQAIERFRAGRRVDRRVAAILTQGERWTDADLDNLSVDPSHKCILLVALAEGHPRRSATLLDLAEKLNFERQFPYHFLKRMIARLRRRGEVAQARP